ncbi:hypothetical protein M2459_001452 [Parabacteroides sp. PF5-5]|uniref:hypothetical protein n=1 Tax=unclassified Parabacteroides TaxID=2649774 RepID=UPI002476C246|nr:MULTISPECIES: hypothetical protein [unclassified Parabacteroides]MDH6304715.1 hypothetical protein [Parabacteroides sp. PH5-39]MDH6315670.1 hypothetical protein [Parabacteroides sp. PF5-13]MDH6319331.1 hypothetical protein [Parabacteroides sp. PH5-13]MDH6323062.1 hypothetical protein [Parabacteroides sp. PH5-8]MDH6326863.1 hypothetical protein [Parabacteroides sp. PH5-41]
MNDKLAEMMKHLKLLIIPLLFIFASCDNDNKYEEKYDIPEDEEIKTEISGSENRSGYELAFTVANKEWDSDMLNIYSMYNIIPDISVTYNGKTYTIDEDTTSTSGFLKVTYNQETDKNILVIDGLNPETKNEELSIDWGDGTKDVVKIQYANKAEKKVYYNDKDCGNISLLNIKRPINPLYDRIWDFINYSIVFLVQDKDGNDLLNSGTKNHIDTDKIVALYKDWRYNLVDQTKALLPRDLGLRLEYVDAYNSYAITFGEFAPFKYKQESFTIDWGDGTSDEITFDLYMIWKKGDPIVKKALHLNDEFLSDKSFLITLTK